MEEGSRAAIASKKIIETLGGRKTITSEQKAPRLLFSLKKVKKSNWIVIFYPIELLSRGGPVTGMVEPCHKI